MKKFLMPFLLVFVSSSFAQLNIVTTVPSRNALNVNKDVVILVSFTQDINPTTLTSSNIRVYGSQTGLYSATISYDSSTRTVMIDPVKDFKPGEVVSVILTRGIRSVSGDSMLSSYIWSFTVKVDDGSGVFAFGGDYAVGSGPTGIAFGDIDGDGDLDIVVANSYESSISILRNNGNGTFGSRVDYVVGNPVDVAFGDIDGDGDLDIGVTNRYSNSVSILKNNGDGTFVGVSYGVKSRNVNGIAFGDIDGDGDLDIVVVAWEVEIGITVSILRNNGDGTFGARVDYDIWSGSPVFWEEVPRGVGFVDIDGDGDLDIGVTNWGSNSVSILRNNGDGTFGTKIDYGVGNNPHGSAFGDIDGDGDIDLGVANRWSNSVSILRNNGDGTFGTRIDYGFGNNLAGIAFGDIDGDGDIDLGSVGGDLYTGTVSIVRNNGDGTFVAGSIYGVRRNPQEIAFGDIDGDGDIDVGVTNFWSGSVSIFRNRNRSADIGLSTGLISFGDVQVGLNKTMYLKIYNDGTDSTLRVNLSLGSGSSFSLSGASLTIPGSGVDSVGITFSPTSYGAFEDSVIVTSNDPYKPRLVVKLVGYSGNNYVSGVVTENTVWTRSNSPYIVSGHIGVDAGVKLRIESGVRVVFKGRYNFNVDGILEVEGAEGDSVVFTSLYPDTMRYPGIRFRSGSSGSFRYARVEYSDNGIWSNGSAGIEVYNSVFERNGYGISDTSGNLIVRGSKFLRNGVGVRVSSVSSVSIDSCIFEENTSNGVNFSSGSKLTVLSSRFLRNGSGIVVSSVSSVSIDSCIFEGNTSDGVNFYSSNGYVRYSNFVGNGAGVRANGGSVEVGENRFERNTSGIVVDQWWTYGTLKVIGNEIKSGGSGINYSGASGYLEVVNNVISDNSGWGMYLYYVGGGIARGNLVSGNGSGVYIWEGGGVNFERNRVVNNRGVGLETNRDISIRENVISGNLGDGINTRGNNQILYNDIFNNFGDGIEASSKPVVNYNNIWGNGGYDFRATLQASDSIDARNNWWGTADRNEIRLRIYDFYDDGVTVRVRFEPYYSEKVGVLAVSGFKGISKPGGLIELVWDRHPFALRYVLYKGFAGSLDTTVVWVELDSSATSYVSSLSDGLYSFGIRAISYDGRKSPLVVLDSVVSDSRAPVLVYAFGVQRDSVITVKFNEAVDFSSIFDVVNWEVKGLGVKKVKVRNGLIARYYNYSGDTSNVTLTLVRVDTVSNINYYWGWGSPGVGVNSDNFKIVYEGLIYIPEDGSYWFRVEVDDIFKMWIDDVVVLSGGYGSETWVNLTRGFHKFRGEYIEYSGDAYVRLYWRNWGEIVPGDNFYLPSQVSFDLVLDGLLPSADSLIYVRVRNVKDLVGNVSGEQVYEFYPDDGNSNPKVVLSRITAEVSGDVRIGYVVSDLEGDSVRLRVEYSVNGVDWNRASIVGDTLIGRSRYSGYLIWRSGLDLPNYGGDVIFRITPRDNDPHNWGEGDRIILRVDNYHGHRVSFVLVDTLVEYSDSVRISYSLVDTSRDVLRLRGYYRRETDSLWRVAKIYGDTINLDTTKYAGEIIWLSREDLAGYDGDVWLKFEVNDGWVSNFSDSLRFRVDNNNLPSVSIVEITTEQSDSVRISYVLRDDERDTLRIRLEYSEDGEVWKVCSVFGDTVIVSSRYSGFITWLSRVDLPGVDRYVYVRIIPFDNDIGVSDTIVFRLDNNYPPVVKIDSVFGVKRVTGAYRDTLRFYFTVTDVEGDTVFVSFYYKSADTLGSEWRRVVTFTGDSGLLVPGSGYEVLWATGVDLAGLVGNYYFKVECSDVDIGVSDSVLIQIDNLGVPRVGILNTFAGEYRDSVRFDYRVLDEEGDPVVLVFEYSLDGERWIRATVVGDSLLSDSTRYEGSVIWLTREDLPGVDDTVMFRIVPFDANRGVLSSVAFHLDNNEVPVVYLDSIGVIVGGDVGVRFRVFDAEGDSLSYRYRYRFDSVWVDADVEYVGSVGDRVVVLWHSYNDLPDTFGIVYFGVIPYDRDEGRFDSILVRLDNKIPGITVNPIVGEVSEDVEISYEVVNDTLSEVVLVPEYFYDGSWHRARVEGDTVVGYRKYSGSFVWKSNLDLDGQDIDSLMFRVVPKDMVVGVADTIVFHLDNNEVPVITYVETPQVEKSGAFEIKFVAFDQERDLLSFKFEYSVGDTMNWRGATVRMGSRYNDTLGVIWLSDSDLPNQDVWVYFKITPFDRDTGRYAISGRFKVDNQTGPIILSSYPINVSFYNDTIKLRFDRKVYGVGAGVKIYGSLTGEHRFNASSFDSVFYLIPSPHFASAETVTVKIIADSLRDSNGNTFDGDKDGDPEGSPVDDVTLTFVSTIPGDYNLDKKVNIEDLALFRDVWVNKHASREIGPATGKPPQMIVQPDGKVDFEDLMVFVMNWNWTVKTGGFKLASKLFENDDSNGLVITVAKAYKEQLLMLDRIEPFNKYSRIGGSNDKYINYDVRFNLANGFSDTIYAGEFVFKYDPEVLQFVGIKDRDVFGKLDSGKTIFLSYVDSVNGLIVIDFANFGNLGMLGNDVVARIEFKAIKESKGEGVIAYELFGVSGNVYDFYERIELSTIPDVPKEFALLQNYPNPFNPNTVIRYHVPRYSRVIIKVYDVIGREVTVLVDDYFKPGYYEVVWDSRRRSDNVEVSSGVYFYVMEAVEEGRSIFRDVKKMVVIK